MNRDGDAASCAALAASLRSGAQRLRGTTDRLDREAADLVDDLEAVADALGRFAVALRDPRPPRQGRPFPHTALRTALRELLDRRGDGASTVTS